MADENQNPSSTDTTSTTNATTTTQDAGSGSATAQTNTPNDNGLAAALAVPGAAPSPESKTEAPKPVVPAGAPEKYTDFTIDKEFTDKGFSLDKAKVAEVEPMFRELGLSQEQAQKLINHYVKESVKTNEAGLKANRDAWNTLQDTWREEVKRDPDLGKLSINGNFGPESKLVQTMNRALDGLQNPKLVSDFKAAMDLTGAGNHPAFVKVFYAMASKLTEGTQYITGGVPRPQGARPSAGASMYHNLPSEADRR